MKYELRITADHNDGDYITEINTISEDDLRSIRTICKVIKKQSGHNWPNGESDDESVEELYKGKLSLEQIEFFEGFVPYNEWGVHTIKSVTVVPKQKEEVLV